MMNAVDPVDLVLPCMLDLPRSDLSEVFVAANFGNNNDLYAFFQSQF